MTLSVLIMHGAVEIPLPTDADPTKQNKTRGRNEQAKEQPTKQLNNQPTKLTKPNRTNPNLPNYTTPNQTKPNQTKPTRPAEPTKPINQSTKPNQTRRKQTKIKPYTPLPPPAPPSSLRLSSARTTPSDNRWCNASCPSAVCTAPVEMMCCAFAIGLSPQTRQFGVCDNATHLVYQVPAPLDTYHPDRKYSDRLYINIKTKNPLYLRSEWYMLLLKYR